MALDIGFDIADAIGASFGTAFDEALGWRESSLEDKLAESSDGFGFHLKSLNKVARKAKVELLKLVEDNNRLLGPQFDLAKSSAEPNYGFAEACSETERAELHKIFFMSSQVAVAEAVTEQLWAQHAAWASNFDVPDTQTQEDQLQFYDEATKLLRSMEQSFHDVVLIDSKLFGQALKASMELLYTHPKILGGIVGGGAVLGALAGAGALHLHMGIHAFLVGLFGSSTGAAATGGALLGGVAGLLVGAVAVGTLLVYEHSKKTPTDKHAEDLKNMKKRISQIAKKDKFISRDLTELHNLFDKAFCQPMVMALEDKECPVCFGHFPADGGKDSECPMKSPNCEGNHMVHRRCLHTWQQSYLGSDMRCIMCRV